MAKKTVGAKSSLSRANLDPSICETGICSISEMEFAYQEYIASAYSAAMLEKRYKEGVAAGIAELLAMVEKVEKQIQIYHFTSAKAGVVLEVLGAIRSVEEECTSSAPVMDVPAKVRYLKKVSVLSLNLPPSSIMVKEAKVRARPTEHLGAKNLKQLSNDDELQTECTDAAHGCSNTVVMDAVEGLLSLGDMSRSEIAIQATPEKKGILCHVFCGYFKSDIWDMINTPQKLITTTEVGKKGMHMVEDMVHNLEKTINQLPVRNVQNMSQAEKESLETTLEELNASFDECLQNYEMVRKKWTRYAEILKVITEDNMLVFKKRCDDLMKRLSDISLKLSSLRAAETAREFLKI